MAGHSKLQRIIEQTWLEPWFQPIVDLRDGQLLGHEALIRGPADSGLTMPDSLFSAAAEEGLLCELELCCRKVTLHRFAELRPAGKLFLNISASLLNSPLHQQGFTSSLLAALEISHHDIVIELSEQHPFDRTGLTLNAVEHYRRMGFEVAIDDLGSGYSGLRLWSDLRPEYVKIDKHFISGVDTDPVKREFVRSICNIARISQCRVIAEGIETEGELRVLQQMGIAYGQGFYLGRPAPLPLRGAQHPDHRILCPPIRAEEEHESTAFTLLREVPTVSPSLPLGSVHRLLLEHPQMSFVPVLHEGRPLGVIRKSELLEIFSTQYGRALYEQKPASKLLSHEVVIVEGDLALSEVSGRVTEQEADTLQQELIITRDGAYMGVGRVRDLLKRITELEINNARYANPLTLLPGNVPINRETERLLRHGQPFHVAYFDINHFKPFNDSYGYSQGDLVIRLLGELISRFAGHGGNFIGHIGGDDFVVLFQSSDWQRTCERILDAFDEGIRRFYSAEELTRGGFEATDRTGAVRLFPLLGLAIGVVSPDCARCQSYNQVAELASDAKKQAKAQPGSALFISRRRGGEPCSALRSQLQGAGAPAP